MTATLESLTQRVLLIETHLERQQARLQSISDQQTVQMQSHSTLHDEVRNLSARPGYATAGPNNIDKLLMPQRYGGEKDKWRQFSSKLISCIGKTYPKVKPIMEELMGRTKVVDSAQLADYGLPEECLLCLSQLLTALLEGEA